MDLLSFIVLVVLMTAGFGSNIDDFWDKQPELEMVRNVRSQRGECGIRPFDDFQRHDVNENRIVNGEYASYGEFPWHVSVDLINHTNYDTRLLNCGASIINEFWLVTAAHCVPGRPSDYYVTAGNHHWTNRDASEQSFNVQKIVKHERYRVTKLDYDITLLKIQPVDGKGIQFNDYVQPVCLPDSGSSLEVGTKCLIPGWGRTKNASYNTYPGLLKKAELAIISLMSCRQTYVDGITTRMLCALDARRHSFTCKGDSGGGLVYKTRGAYTLVGTNSGGSINCNNSGVFADVNNFLPWIQSKLELYSDSLEEGVLPRRQ